MSRAHILPSRLRGELEAYVVQVDQRFYCRVGKLGQIQTAWSVAGAKLFVDDRDAQGMAAHVQGKRPRAAVSVRVVRLVPEAFGGAA